MLSERLYGGIRKKSIEYFQKVYRFSLTAPYKRSVPSHSPLRFLRTNDPYSTISCPNISHSQLRYLRTSAPIPSTPCPIITHLPLRYFRINDPIPPIFRCNTTRPPLPHLPICPHHHPSPTQISSYNRPNP